MVATETAASHNEATTITCVEPYPSKLLDGLPIDLIKRPVQQLDADFFSDTLADGDILFIDSTHTVKASSDCCHLYLRVLPQLRRKLTVHVHDIFLPTAIDVKAAFEHQVYWTEQHLLSAYLLDNPKIRFLFGSTFARYAALAEAKEFMGGRSAPGWQLLVRARRDQVSVR